eukprot:404774-Rhodomonas_salina.1
MRQRERRAGLRGLQGGRGAGWARGESERERERDERGREYRAERRGRVVHEREWCWSSRGVRCTRCTRDTL